MKNPKNLTRKQKRLLSKKGLDHSDYKFIKTKEDKHIFYNLKTNKEKYIDVCWYVVTVKMIKQHHGYIVGKVIQYVKSAALVVSI